MNDPIVDEVRRAREEHARQFNYDLAAICSDLRKQQSKYGDRVVRLRRDRPESLRYAESPFDDKETTLCGYK